jgi:hypothetical protein
LIIADIPVEDTPLLDTLYLLRASLKEKVFLQTLCFLARTAASQYSRIRASKGLLPIPVLQLLALVQKLSFDGHVVTTPLTSNPKRAHVLIKM